MKMKKAIFSYFLILLCSACVDRISFDTEIPAAFPVVIDGYISDQPGPYTIKISKAFDIESKFSLRTPISVKRLTISDNAGNSEDLVAVSEGEYQTNPNGIRGAVGRTYKLRVELLDGRTYESKPDMLMPSGKVDRVYFQYNAQTTSEQTTEYGFDVFFDASAGEQENFNFMWKFAGTFKYDTNPELYTVACGESRCPRPLPCSSYILGTDGQLQYVKPCECCSCWTSILNPDPVISDNQLIEGGKFLNVNGGYIPITEWTFMYKVHAEIQQFSLSPQAFAFWKAIRDQKKANGSLFEPQSGRIPSNFIQLGGVTAPIEGIFFATSIQSNSVYITPADVPNPGVIPPVSLPFTNTCKELFPNSTTVKPPYWID
jgi:hypothetical protein